MRLYLGIIAAAAAAAAPQDADDEAIAWRGASASEAAAAKAWASSLRFPLAPLLQVALVAGGAAQPPSALLRADAGCATRAMRSHLMPWYDVHVKPVLDAAAPAVGINGLLRALPRMRGCLAPGSGGDAQGMMMHYLGTYLVDGLGASAAEALALVAQLGDLRLFKEGRGLTHGVVWADLGRWAEDRGLRVPVSLSDDDARAAWARASAACKPPQFRCRFFYVSCVHGIGHAFQRLSHDAHARGYRRLDAAEVGRAAGAAVGAAEQARRYPGVEACGFAPTRDEAYHCATGFYHDESNLVETTAHLALLEELRRAPAGDVVRQKHAWTHERCVGAPFEASCFVRLYEGVFAAAVDGEAGGDGLGLGPRDFRACVFARYLYEPMDPAFFARAVAAPGAAHVFCADRVPGGRRTNETCVVHPIARACAAYAADDARLACVWGAALGTSRALRLAFVHPRLARLYCAVFPDARFSRACERGLLGWTGLVDDPDHPSVYGAELHDRRGNCVCF
ncbi:hypothetical protein JL720_14980 [Aureococcus anophagefferens]|nr:hypothetical protein JL720_14980 [Aureococcus anophagefferens]